MLDKLPKDIFDKEVSNYLNKVVTGKVKEATKKMYEQTSMGYLYDYNPHINGFYHVIMQPGTWVEDMKSGGGDGFLFNETDGLFEEFHNKCGLLSYDIDIPQLNIEYESYSSRNKNLNYATKVNLSGDFSIKYLEDQSMAAIRYQSSWLQYMEASKKGYMNPTTYTGDESETIDIPYFNSIYVIIFNNFGTKIKGIVKLMGVAPINLPIKDVLGDRNTNNLTMVNCNYKCNDMIYEFYSDDTDNVENKLSEEVNSILGGNSNIIKHEENPNTSNNITSNPSNINNSSSNESIEAYTKLEPNTNTEEFVSIDPNSPNLLNIPLEDNEVINNDIKYEEKILVQKNDITNTDPNSEDYNVITNNIKSLMDENFEMNELDSETSAKIYKLKTLESMDELDYITKNSDGTGYLHNLEDGKPKAEKISSLELETIQKKTHDNLFNEKADDTSNMYSTFFLDKTQLQTYQDVDNKFLNKPDLLGYEEETLFKFENEVDNSKVEAINDAMHTDTPSIVKLDEIKDKENIDNFLSQESNISTFGKKILAETVINHLETDGIYIESLDNFILNSKTKITILNDFKSKLEVQSPDSVNIVSLIDNLEIDNLIDNLIA